MNNDNQNQNPHLKEDSGKWGLILILALVFGIPLAGFIVKLIGG